LFNLQFQSKYYDRETELYYFTARYLDPRSGKWLCRDPKGESTDVNLTKVCGGDPVGRWDNLGLEDNNEVVLFPMKEWNVWAAKWKWDYQPPQPVAKAWVPTKLGGTETVTYTTSDWVFWNYTEALGPLQIWDRATGHLQLDRLEMNTVFYNKTTGTGIGPALDSINATYNPFVAFWSHGAEANSGLGIDPTKNGVCLSPGERVESGFECVSDFGRGSLLAFGMYAFGKSYYSDFTTAKTAKVLDTNVIISDGKRLVQSGENVVKSCVSDLELQNLVDRGKIHMPGAAADIPRVGLPGVDARINVRAALTPGRQGNFADGIIGATALERDALLLTRDQELLKAVIQAGGKAAIP
ncbi:MAG: RHS repeat-associated core domain-containing protein, partial [bacterium]